MRASRTILLFNVPADKSEQIKGLGDALQAKTVIVTRDDYDQKLGYLAGVMGFPKERKLYNGIQLPDQMLLLSGWDSKALDVFLAEYKKRGIEPIKKKAVITQHNVFWTPVQLYKELEKEKR